MDFVEVYTLKKRNKKIRISKDIYEPVRNLILNALKNEDEISLNRLIEIGEQELGIDYAPDLSWLIVQVKNDLLYREDIAIDIDENRNQQIKLKKTMIKYYGR